MYPPSMLSSAALAHSAQEMQRENLLGDLEFSVNELINRLQNLTRVENVSTKLYTIFTPCCCHQYFAAQLISTSHDRKDAGWLTTPILLAVVIQSPQTSFIDSAL